MQEQPRGQQRDKASERRWRFEASSKPHPLDEYPLAIRLAVGDCPRRKVNHPHKVFVLTSRLHISAASRAACLTLRSNKERARRR